MAADLFNNKLPLILSRKVDFPIGQQGFLSAYKYNHPAVKKIICVSKAIEQIVHQGIRDHSKTSVIYDGIDFERFNCGSDTVSIYETFHLPQNLILIGNVAALAPHKDYYTFVNTARELINKKENLFFLIFGEGKERTNIENYIKSKRMEKHIHLAGFRKDLPGLLPQLDLFLMTSETEGLGSSILDAFYCKVPVVATRAGGIPEIVINEQTGLTAPVKNESALAEQVLRLLTNKELKEILVNNANQFVRNFSMENMAGETYKIYSDLSVHF